MTVAPCVPSEREELEVPKERLSNRQPQQPYVQDAVEAQRKWDEGKMSLPAEDKLK